MMDGTAQSGETTGGSHWGRWSPAPGQVGWKAGAELCRPWSPGQAAPRLQAACLPLTVQLEALGSSLSMASSPNVDLPQQEVSSHLPFDSRLAPAVEHTCCPPLLPGDEGRPSQD